MFYPGHTAIVRHVEYKNGTRELGANDLGRIHLIESTWGGGNPSTWAKVIKIEANGTKRTLLKYKDNAWEINKLKQK